jgi:Zn-dependent peptidase ImmA (M78 family)/DNA-binding XRE family transcriptional regulator
MERFNHSRLDLARRRRGLNKTALARLSGLSTRSLTAYERQEREPTPESVAELSRALHFSPAFFMGEDIDEPSPEGVSFRSLSSMTARQRDQAVGAAGLALLLVNWIGERFELPPPRVPRLHDIDPELAAEEVRVAWGLGQRRIPSSVHLLEAHGVRVFSLAEESAEVDAFSFWKNETPFVFLNTMKSAERSRMDAAHELGHLVLHHHGGPQGRQAEDEAQAFASAFLMPRRTVLADAPKRTSVASIVQAKRRWNVSAMSLVYRMRAVGLLSEWQARSLYVEMSRRGYRRDEPDSIPRESSQVLAKVFSSLRAEGMSRRRVADEIGIPREELERLVFGLVLQQVAVTEEPEPSGGGAFVPYVVR